MEGMPKISDNGKCAMDTSTQNWYQDFTMTPTTNIYSDAITGTGTYIPGASTSVTNLKVPTSPAAGPPLTTRHFTIYPKMQRIPANRQALTSTRQTQPIFPRFSLK